MTYNVFGGTLRLTQSRFWFVCFDYISKLVSLSLAVTWGWGEGMHVHTPRLCNFACINWG